MLLHCVLRFARILKKKALRRALRALRVHVCIPYALQVSSLHLCLKAMKTEGGKRTGPYAVQVKLQKA